MENAKEYLMLAAVLALLVSFYLGMRLLAMKFKEPVFRAIGARLAVFGSLVVLMFILGIYTRDVEPTGVVITSTGPAEGQASVLRELSFGVGEDTPRQGLELTLSGRDRSTGSLRVVARILDPAGKQVLFVDQSLERGEGLRWLPLMFSFVPTVYGEHKLAIEIPAGVSEIRLVVKQLY
jgi:hypothetical protein